MPAPAVGPVMGTNEGTDVVVSRGAHAEEGGSAGRAAEDPTVAADPNPAGRWWFPVLLAAVAFPVNVLGGFTIGLVGSAVRGDTGFATNALWAVVVTTLLVSSVAVHYDRQYVASVSEWTPTRLYYFTFLGYVGMMLAIVYVWRRHRILGVP